MDLSNSFAALDPQNPGFIGLDSESEMDSVSNGRRDDVQNIRGDAMEIDEDIGDEQMNHQHTQNVVFPFSQFVRHLTIALYQEIFQPRGRLITGIALY